MDLEKIRSFIGKQPFIAYPLIGLGVLGLWSMVMLFAMRGANHGSTPLKSTGDAGKSSPIGFSVGGVDQQAYVARLEKNYYDFEDRVKSMEKQVQKMRKLDKELKSGQKDIAKSLLKLDAKLVKALEQQLNQFQQGGHELSSSQSLELAVADIRPVVKPDDDSVYLPLGSFCKGTLLTGVYAAADASHPLPVLIKLDEAFYGPNKTRIPLKDAFVLGQAHADLVSERALIQIVAISSVLPNGFAFEREDNLGFVTDQFGELGLRGEVVRNTGRELALSFMGGFMAGGAQAIADGEVSTSDTGNGGIRREVTGSPAKNVTFSGLAHSAGRLSEHYESQAEKMVPAIHIKNGVEVYFIVHKGVNIDGLSRADYRGLVNHN